MNFRYFGMALALSAPLAAGCKTPPGLVAMERELRYQEDMIYQLQDYIHTYKSHLSACRAENQFLRHPTASRPSTPSQGPPARPFGPLRQKGPVAPSRDAGDENGDLRPPQIHLPPLGTHGPTQPPTADDPFQVVDLEEEDPPARVKAAEPVSTEIAAETQDPIAPLSYEPPHHASDPARREAVATLTLKPEGTAAYEQDGRPAADGIQVWLEPRGAAGKIVPADGTVTVAALDPHRPRSAKPLARWQVKSADLQRFQNHDGIRLKLRWPQKAPPQTKVLVFVRMITSDGLWIYADQLVSLDRQVIDATEPAFAGGRPRKPPTVSPTAHNEPLPAPPSKVRPDKTVPAGPQKTGWTASTSRRREDPSRPPQAQQVAKDEPASVVEDEQLPVAKDEQPGADATPQSPSAAAASPPRPSAQRQSVRPPPQR
ncbi:MAG: hypothetical protein GTO53_00740, partial [Planctomycetales bacterium]|nr:hypothetical protein [Planctomycetales bacterium]NIM07707.1 hypothetical protein [Planctomycetales bacterium]NIN07211.1 hypothetical protein [Planctomycetales bacterium]NIN76304.1 hypothetical protein [Planctomycetales bacterium]NIO33509.1 hypothetical protein [Planctomycetales bacterium]